MKTARTLERGTSMIEVLVTMVIVAIGLLSLAGLQSRLQVSELESYQRAEALVLLKDMANRIATNRSAAANYVTTAPLGASMTCAVTNNTSTRQQIDAAQWCRALQGAAERSNASDVGAMVGGRGCVQSLGSNTYLITIAWQGMAPVSAPPSSVSCGANQYNDGALCTNDRCRRAVTTLVRIGSL